MDELVEPPDNDPIEVKIKKEEKVPEPSFEYDDYDPTEDQINEIEKEFKENIEKRTKHGT